MQDPEFKKKNCKKIVLNEIDSEYHFNKMKKTARKPGKIRNVVEFKI